MKIHHFMPCIPLGNCKGAGFRLMLFIAGRLSTLKTIWFSMVTGPFSVSIGQWLSGSNTGRLSMAKVRVLMVLLAVPAFHVPAEGQVTVSARVSDSVLVGGQVIDLTVSVGEPIDFYSASLEVAFDHRVLDFLGAECSGLSEGGLRFAGQLGEGMKGVSVVRTASLPEPGQGDFLVMSFRVKTMAVAGVSAFTLSDLLITDSGEVPIPAAAILPVSCRVEASITYISLLIPEINEIQEGDLFNVSAKLFASGVTGSERLLCQVGLGAGNTDPSSWDEEVWSDMLYDGNDQEYLLYFLGETGFMKPPGEWFIALRASLDDGSFVYGGLHGIWHNTGSPSGRLAILPRAPYRYTLARWDFNNESLMPAVAVPANRNAVFDIAGASKSGFAAGATGLAANSTGWKDGGDGSKFWFTAISTSGFTSLELSSGQYGSGTGPRDFTIGYSPDGMQWETIDGGNVTVAANWTSGRVVNLSLPPAAENSEVLYLRWVMASDTSINGDIVSAAGTSRIDDVLVTGLNMYPETVDVYPGDTNNDGVVNADDVLPLGIYWLYTGPRPLWGSTGFNPRTTEGWIPRGATFADANGDGIVNHKDLAAVGFNFGRSTGITKKSSKLPVSVLLIDPAEKGNTVQLMLVAEKDVSLSGVAFSIEAEGIPADMWEIGNITAAFAGNHPADRILSFGFPAGGIFEGAVAFKGGGKDVSGKKLAQFELRIDQSWNEAFTLKLNRLSLGMSNPPGIVPVNGQLAFDGVTSGRGVDQVDMSRLKAFPNPFSSSTTISFRLDSPSLVRIEITDMQGRLLFTPVNGFREHGYHEFTLSGQQMAPGIYFCRLVLPDGNSSAIKISLVK